MMSKVNRVLSAAVIGQARAPKWLTGMLLAGALLSGAPLRGETRALLVGVSRYQSASIPDLAGPTNDLAAMERLMRAEGANDLTLLSDAQVTRSSVESSLFELGRRARPGDWIVFYYSGHGAQSVAAERSTRDGDFDQFLPLTGFDPADPVTERFIVDKDFYDWFASYIPRDVNVLMVADTCHSGSLNRAVDTRALRTVARRALNGLAGEIKLTARPAPRFNRILTTERSSAPLVREDLPNLIYVGAAQDGQLALEMALPTEGKPARGLLTFAFEQGLTRKAADGQTLLADLDADGQVTAGELSIYLDSQVRALSAQQQQPRTTFASGRENTPLFVMKGVESPEEDRPRPQIHATSGQGLERLQGEDQPWIVVSQAHGADFVWDDEAGDLLWRSGDLIAQDIRDAAAVRGVVEKWAVFDELRPLMNEARTQLDVLPDGGAAAYRTGQVMTVNLSTRTAGQYATVFNLASDGTVQFLFPTDPADGEGLMGARGLAGLVEARVIPPYGVDHVVAVTAPTPQTDLHALLRTIDGQRASGRVTPAIRRILAATPGRVGLSIVEIFTQR